RDKSCNIVVCFVLTSFFFFQAEDGIRDRNVTGVQTCALPIYFESEASAHMKTIDQYELFKLLLNDMGETGWWPADSIVEIIIGAIMIQNTNAANAKRAVNNIGSATKFNPQAILNLPLETLEDLVRPAGFFKNKSKAVHSVLNWFQEHDNNLEAITKKYEINLRQELLKLH